MNDNNIGLFALAFAAAFGMFWLVSDRSTSPQPMPVAAVEATPSYVEAFRDEFARANGRHLSRAEACAAIRQAIEANATGGVPISVQTAMLSECNQ